MELISWAGAPAGILDNFLHQVQIMTDHVERKVVQRVLMRKNIITPLGKTDLFSYLDTESLTILPWLSRVRRA